MSVCIVSQFEKIPEEQWLKDTRANYNQSYNDPLLKKFYDELKLPTRATVGSAGHDFYLPYAINVGSGESIVVCTGIRCKIDDGWCLTIMPRSSLGFKYQVMLANTIGLIDSDYYNANNYGHIMIKLVNTGKQHVVLAQGERFAQGLFLPYGVAASTVDVETQRTGGMGSTGTK